MKTPSQADNDAKAELKRQRNREAAARYRERNRERYNQRMRDWRKANPDRARQMALEHRNRKLAQDDPAAVAAFRAKEAEVTRRTQARVKSEVYEAYGGYKCRCYGETEPLFLSIDHVHNDGAAMRKAKLYSGSGTGFYQWLRKNKFPDGFQVLCMNCQVGKHKNGGVCPHQQKV